MKVAFLDRDGTVIKYPPNERWIESIDAIELFPGTIDALKLLAQNDFGIVLITNQEGIAMGRISEEEFWNVNNHVVSLLETSGITVLKTYMNGEASGLNASKWRKPGPKMLTQAAKDLNINIGDVYMVGDSQSDVVASKSAGCKGGILINYSLSDADVHTDAKYIASNLLDAANFIINNN
jgi:imidazoleglycerol-phosphate dehydratase/histidinol-phosphatase